MSVLLIPLTFIFVLIYSKIKKINTYECFVNGAKGAIPLTLSIFPYIASILIATALLKVSGITDFISKALSPLLLFLGIPNELCELVVLRPFSGAGSFAMLKEVITTYGPDSYITRCACTILGCSETIFYVATIYISQTKIKKLLYAIPIALFCSIIGAIVACLCCRII